MKEVPEGTPLLVPAIVTASLSNRAAPSAYQINDENHQPHNQEQVNQASTDMQAETQKPQNQKNNENCPKHVNPLCSSTSKRI